MVLDLSHAPKEPHIAALAEERVVLHNISWETFERLLTESGEKRSARFYYLEGTLEIMSPLSRHEGSNRFIESLITVIAEELNLNLRKLGSLTMKRRDQQAGGEPDSCYYIQNEPQVRDKEEIDLTIDPPPDLVLEVDITNPSDRRLPIYANLGVPELWKYDGKTLQYYVLQNQAYAPVDRSSTFPWLPASIVLEFLAKRFEVGEIQAIKQFRVWVHQSVHSDH
ncbi:MAG: Uma2 family endonuclease [Leptolyngbyaceae cyanobacterium bins.302]|nr:Uma2 family endonuclease [Leptolyngbyaceae cyanobacterium bins.302]